MIRKKSAPQWSRLYGILEEIRLTEANGIVFGGNFLWRVSLL